MHVIILLQFDEWDDIKDDICNDFHNCCCKQVINKVLLLNNDIKKIKIEYERLKECILTNLSPFEIIHENIINVFTLKLNAKTAKKIVQLFDNIIEESGFEDLEQIKDDIIDQNINDSQIVWHIISNINVQNDQVKAVIYNGIKAIINNEIDLFLQNNKKMDVGSQIDEEKQTMNVCTVSSCSLRIYDLHITYI